MGSIKNELKNTIENLINEYQEYNYSIVVERENLHDFHTLLKNGTPAILKNFATDWKAYKDWKNDEYLSNNVKNDIEIAITPRGKQADSLIEDNGHVYFLEPLNERMKIGEFLEQLKNNKDLNLYLQSQNGNLNYEEFKNLAKDVPLSFNEIDDVMGAQPDAVNIWIG